MGVSREDERKALTMCAFALWVLLAAACIALLGEWPGLIVSAVITLVVILFSYVVNHKKGTK